MLAMLVALLAVDPPPPSVLRIQASEPGAELAVTAEAPGWSVACPGVVTMDRPCELPGAREQAVVDLHVSGTRAFDSKVLLGKGATTTVRIDHRDYTITGVGLAMVAGAIAIIAAGVITFQDGHEMAGRTLVSIGAGIEATGEALVFTDLSAKHDRAVVVE
jgi:hypothetical protein